VAKGLVNSLSCDLGSNGFTLIKSYGLDEDGNEVTETGGDGQWIHSNIYAGGMMLATYDATGAHYHVTDWLGTRRVQTDYLGRVEGAWSNLPFGEMTLGVHPGATSEHFTGYQHDTESDNDYAQARYYQSALGRFISPDPSRFMFADKRNPQSLNLYGYVLNNPMNSVDPSGMGGCTLEGIDVDCGTVQNNEGAIQCPENNCGLLNQSYRGAYGGSFSLSAGVNGFTWTNNANGEELDAAGAEEAGLADFNDPLGFSGSSAKFADATPAQRSAILAAARRQIGSRYFTGGGARSCPQKGFDCSGLVWYSITQAGIIYQYVSTGGMSTSQYLKKISAGDLQPGDIVLFSGHTGIYDPNQSKPGYDILNAMNKGVGYGPSSWYGPPVAYFRVQVPVP
jgi:RHS repeat-associated protein